MTDTPSRTTPVLMVGATGMLGGRIAAQLLILPQVQLRLLVRPEPPLDAGKEAALDGLIAAGAQVVAGDLADPDSLVTATTGVDVVVSAIQGGRDVVVNGQVALARAAADNGVRRILPSDFALDIFKAPPGEHASFDLRRDADEIIAGTGIQAVHILNGALMDGFVDAFFDHEARTATFWGSGEETFDATTVEDTARYTARAAMDPAVPVGKFAVAGEQLSFGRMVNAVEAATGRSYTRRSLGTIDDLRQAIEDIRQSDPDPMARVMLAYQLFMLTGVTALENLQNGRYPDIHPELFVDIAARALDTSRPS